MAEELKLAVSMGTSKRDVDATAASIDELGKSAQDAGEDLATLAGMLNRVLEAKAKLAGKPTKIFDVKADIEALTQLNQALPEVIALNRQHGGVGAKIIHATGGAMPKSVAQIPLAGISGNKQEVDRFVALLVGKLIATANRKMPGSVNTGLTADDYYNPGKSHSPTAPGANPAHFPGGSPNAPKAPKEPDTRGGLNDAARHLAGQVLAGSGNGAAGAGVAGAARGLAGMLPGGLVGGGLIGLAGYALFKGVGSAADGVERAKGEAVEVDRFKKILGDVGVDFDGLRDHIRDAADGMGLSFAQAGKMAEVFGRTADTRSKDVAALGDETANAAAVSRATGIDPEAVSRFFGEVRAAKATGNVDDSKRMALMIADAIKRSGGSINADRMLAAMSTFAERTKEQSLGPVNVAGYGGLLSGLIGGGLKAGTAAGMLGTLDASLRNPQSEMMDAFVHEAIGGGSLGYGNSMRLKQAGMFASTQSVFGNKASPFYDPGFKGATGQTTIDKFMSHLNKSFPGKDGLSKDAKEAALAQLFGGNFAHAREFSNGYAKYGSKGLSDSTDMLKKMGLDASDMKVPGMMQIMEIAAAGGDADKLDKLRLGMLGRKDIDKDQKTALEKSAGKGPEAMQRVMVDIARTLDAEKTDGQALNDYAKSMDNNLQLIGTKMIPAIEMSNSLLGALVDKLAPDSKVARDRVLDAQDAAIKNAGADPVAQKATAEILKNRGEHLLPGIFEAERRHGLKRGELAGLIDSESSFRHDVYGTGVNKEGKKYSTKAYGLGQMTPAAVADATPEFEKEYRRSPNIEDPFDQIKLSAIYKSIANKRGKGDTRMGDKIYFAGAGGLDGSGQVSKEQIEAYANKMQAKRDQYAQSTVGLGIYPIGGTPPAGNPSDQTPLAGHAMAKKRSVAGGNVERGGMGDHGSTALDAQIKPTITPRPVQTPAGNPQKAAEQASATMGITVGGSVQAQLRLIDQQMQDRGSVVINAPVSGKSVPSGARR